MARHYCCQVKLVLLGESSVGKSSIVTRFTTGEFRKNQATIGAAFTTRSVQWEEDAGDGSDAKEVRSVTFEIWDTAGQERYRSLAPMYYRNTDVALVVYDVTEQQSFQNARSWIDELNTYIGEAQRNDVVVRIVGNKIDLHAGGQLEQPLPSATFVSAKTGEGIEELFMDIAKHVKPERFVLQAEPQESPQRSILNVLGASSADHGCRC
ncbi:AEL187Cp [Eremothecium gossypii ATCC 10895]|uniref:AEL187Cp n=1 Tax=Eremothecium gossypii (strain ATCC 10895 / CBS 109.51 / FGSC 9923 / NRRL Y-1056) TaxID=284811 RepID=Q758E9_EREGS|nr:AEL187Cp [Eremothecium gossypii ATCC 10895]AAS52498.1 AEL187Cp [Eremothecium gossypii ATCC 10895]AEY96798.1 FAEL187Cp [Eremothecium gossypii FDAG1]